MCPCRLTIDDEDDIKAPVQPKESVIVTRRRDESDLEWLRAQMDAFLPEVFPFYRKEDDPEVENKEDEA